MKQVAIDFETYLIDTNGPFPRPVCLSSSDPDHALVTDRAEMIKLLGQWLQQDTIIAHNAVFECGVIYYWLQELRPFLFKALSENRIMCTQINEQLLDNIRKKPGRKYSLAALVLRYYNKNISGDKKDPKAWRLRYSELDDVPLEQWPQKAIDYAIEDSLWAEKIASFQIVPPKQYGPVVTAAVMLNLMSAKGMTVDTSRAELLEKEIYEKIGPIYQELIENKLCTAVKGKAKPKKNMKIFREYILEHVTKPKRTVKGNIATDTESLKEYYHANPDKNIKNFLDIAVYEKVLTAYINNLKHPIVRTQYSATKTTGRTSSSKSKFYPSVNIQQMPRKVPNVTWDVRNCFVPKKGYKLVAIDYAGLELASTAHQLKQVYNHSNMCDTINSGASPVDMHSKLACQIMTGAKNEVVSYTKFMEHKKEEEYAHYRQLSKPINLGFPGGLGFDTMRILLAKSHIYPKYDVICKNYSSKALYKVAREFKGENVRVKRLSKSEYALVYDDLVGLKRELFNLYPELKKFLTQDHQSYMTGKKKWIKNEYDEWVNEPMYRYNIYGFKRDWCTYTAFCNGFLMQTPSAIGAKKAMSTIIEKYLDHEGMNPLAFIHDEIIFEVYDDDKKYAIIDDVAKILIEEMQTVLTSVRITVEAQMMDCWDKAGGDWEKEYHRNAEDIPFNVSGRYE